MATSITRTVITTAINAMVNSSITYHSHAAEVRAYRVSGELSDKEARECFQTAYLSKAAYAAEELARQRKAGCRDAKLLDKLAQLAAYVDQVTDRGFPAQGSAYSAAVVRAMKDTRPEQAAAEVEEIKVTRAQLAAAKELVALCKNNAKVIAKAIALAKAAAKE